MSLVRLLTTSALITLCAAATAAENKRVRIDDQGRIIPIPVPIPEQELNPWPASYFDGFYDRVQVAIQSRKGNVGGSKALENEKSSYPTTMLAWFADPADREAAIRFFEAGDPNAGWYRHTEGIDFYWCFTLKGQMRKYFYFGPFLSDGYRATMKRGATAWVATDPRPNTELVLLVDSPNEAVAAYAQEAMRQMWRDREGVLALAEAAEAEGGNNKLRFAEYMRTFAEQVGDAPPTDTAGWQAWWAQLCVGDWMVYEEYDRRVNLRPHPEFGIGRGPVGTDWSPQTRGGIVDWRNTDNLRAMRETSVYLMAEETDSELVRQIYKEKLRYNARMYLSVGNGEWDSESYHSHTMAAYMNLYDFAQDPEVRMLAKGILDYFSAAAALKYFRGLHIGPIKRDYGNVAPFPSPADVTWLWAGDTSLSNDRPDYDQAHFVSTNYRPPAAVVALAQGRFARPAEFLNSKPPYQLWLPGNDEAPQYHETIYVANTYKMGSLREGGGWDVNGCKIAVSDGQGGARFFIPSTQERGNICTNARRDERFAQHRNALVVLKRAARGTPQWNFVVPDDVHIEQEGGVTFLRFAETWAAIHPINATISGLDRGRLGRFQNVQRAGNLAILAGEATDAVTGMAIEMGEEASHGDFASFKRQVLEQAQVDISGLADGRVDFTAASGAQAGLTWTGGNNLEIRRGGAIHSLADHRDVYRTVDGEVLSLGWKEGILRVNAGGHSFTGTFDYDTGTYSSTQTLAE